MKTFVSEDRMTLVTVLDESTVTVATRPGPDAVWAPPVVLKLEESWGTPWIARICDCGHDEKQHAGMRSLSPYSSQPCCVPDCGCPSFRRPGENPRSAAA